MMKAAHGALREALALAPTDAGVLRAMGDLAYNDPDCGPGDALGWFERALEQAPADRWALLHRAHCLQDLERWRDAADAYSLINPARFEGPSAWRYEHLLEQRAYCRLRAGELEQAETEFVALLDRWERSPQLASQAWGRHLAEAARGALHAPLFARARALFQREEDAREQRPRRGAAFGLTMSMLDTSE